MILILGLCVGSFLNVLIYRLPREEKITGYSYCPHCQKRLQWFDLIPVFSFLFLKGRCRYCQKPISWQYPLVELSTAILFIFATYNWQQTTGDWRLATETYNLQNLLILGCLLLVVSCLIVIFVVDLKYMLVPDAVIYLAIGAAFLYQLFQLTTYNLQLTTSESLTNSLLSGIFASAFFLFFVLVSRGKWMGMGDVKIAAFMGVLLSFPNILFALLLAFVSGSIIGLSLVFAKKKTFKSEIAFGCFLAPATYIAVLYGERITKLYFNIY